ncbi:MAG TPA: hemerythrin domain-containing protein [Usitatibacter sp.]|nr:hemerythrin domain-containing protein [Usitatibacter sp.]
MATDDIREQLSDSHGAVMALVRSLREETDELQCHSRLEELRHAWAAHFLAEETVVYHVLDGLHAGDNLDSANKRLVEHELVQSFFDRLSRTRPGTPQWFARLEVIDKLMQRHMDDEREELFARLVEELEPDVLSGLSRDFGLARDKISILEQAKSS